MKNNSVTEKITGSEGWKSLEKMLYTKRGQINNQERKLLHEFLEHNYCQDKMGTS